MRRMMPDDLPSWEAIYQQSQRRLGRCVSAQAYLTGMMLRWAAGR